MQLKIARNPKLAPNRSGEDFPDIAPGTVIENVVGVHLCRMSPDLRSVQLKGGSFNAEGQEIDTYMLVPAHTIILQEAPGWQQYARTIEEKARENKAAA